MHSCINQTLTVHTWTASRRTIVRRLKEMQPTSKFVCGDIDFLGFNKLVGVYSTKYKFLWFIALTVSSSLCLWQVSTCLSKYFTDPISTETTVEIFNQYSYPAITICPSTIVFGYDFIKPFNRICDQHLRCKSLNETQRMEFPFDGLNITLMNLWLAKKIRMQIKLKCKFAINSTLCIEESEKIYSYEENYRDTIAGRCYLVYHNIDWFYTGKTVWPWVLEQIETDETLAENPNYLIDTNIHGSPVVEKLFIGYQTMRKGCSNRLELTITEVLQPYKFDTILPSESLQFQYINTSKNLCTNEETVTRCLNNCFEKLVFNKNPKCKWPFLSFNLFELNLPYCNSLKEVEGFRDEMMNIKFLLSKCNCGRACRSIAYSSTVTSYVGINQTVIGIVLTTDTKQVVTEFYSYGFSSCLADLGGSIGIFLGISLLTLLDFVHTLIKNWFKFS